VVRHGDVKCRAVHVLRRLGPAHRQVVLGATICRANDQWFAQPVVQRLNGRISRLRALTLATTDRSISGPAHMARIGEAICNNDAAAAKAVSDHLTDASEIARMLLENER